MKKAKQRFNKRKYGKLWNNQGMTMAEMLVTVAIIIILCGVAFISLIAYQRSLAQTKRDGYAKEIFIAAQNHLTMARGEGYLDLTRGANTDEKKAKVYGVAEEERDVYYFLVNDGKRSDGSLAYTNSESSPASLLDLMLPFGSIDETVRMGGSYVIRYQAREGKILDVFYCTTSGSPERFNYTLSDDDYDDIMALRDDKSGRRNYNGAVLGYYGGTEADNIPTVSLKAPSIKVHNDETLYVEIIGARKVGKDSDDRKHANLKLIITGVDSKAKKAIDISELVGANTPSITAANKDRLEKVAVEEGATDPYSYTYTLDDISKANTHFVNLGQDTAAAASGGKYFIAGEDIKVEAVVYSKTAFANIEFSNAVTENSLYESIADPQTKPEGPDAKIAYISKIRHLENLNPTVSHTGLTTKVGDNKKMAIIAASQTENLDWSNFKTKTKGTEVFTQSGIGSGGYYPVNPGNSIVYDGLRHSIKGIAVSESFKGSAGVFGETSGSKIKNLKLIDLMIYGNNDNNITGDAGALVGTASSTSIYNVVAYNTNDYDKINTATVTSSSGSAGGLVGKMDGGTIKYCGAALVVSGQTNAGGLIGRIGSETTTVNACYSGGHTDNAEYYEDGDKEDPLYNVYSSNGYAGGLIGYAGKATIENSYSTCSVNGSSPSETGGFVGYASGEIVHCYCTGMVSGEKANNAFIGSGGAAVSNQKNKESYYLQSVNEYVAEDKTGIEFKGAGNDNVIALDKDYYDADTKKTDETIYEGFVQARETWNDAVPYDNVVNKYYNGRYNLKTVTQLETTDKTRNTPKKKGVTDKDTLFVDTHYGDWPAPEIFIINN